MNSPLFSLSEPTGNRARGHDPLLSALAARLTDFLHAHQPALQQLVAERVPVAIRLRHHHGRDPIDTHAPAMRLKDMGYEKLLHAPLDTLAAQATLHFLLHDEALNRSRSALVCIGPFDAGARDYLLRHSSRKVDFVDQAAPDGSLVDAVLFVSDRALCELPSANDAQARNLQVVHEGDLCRRFGLVSA